MSNGYPDGCNQSTHDRAFDELGPGPDEDEAYERWVEEKAQEIVEREMEESELEQARRLR